MTSHLFKLTNKILIRVYIVSVAYSRDRGLVVTQGNCPITQMFVFLLNAMCWPKQCFDIYISHILYF